MRIFFISFLLLLTTGCSSTYLNQQVTGKSFPIVSGENLEQEQVQIPSDFTGDFTLLLERVDLSGIIFIQTERFQNKAREM